MGRLFKADMATARRQGAAASAPIDKENTRHLLDLIRNNRRTGFHLFFDVPEDLYRKMRIKWDQDIMCGKGEMPDSSHDVKTVGQFEDLAKALLQEWARPEAPIKRFGVRRTSKSNSSTSSPYCSARNHTMSQEQQDGVRSDTRNLASKSIHEQSATADAIGKLAKDARSMDDCDLEASGNQRSCCAENDCTVM